MYRSTLTAIVVQTDPVKEIWSKNKRNQLKKCLPTIVHYNDAGKKGLSLLIALIRISELLALIFWHFFYE